MHTPWQTDVSSSSSAPGQPEGCWNHKGIHLMEKTQVQTEVKMSRIIFALGTENTEIFRGVLVLIE